MTTELQRHHWTVNYKRVLRLMRQEALRCHLKRNWSATTDSRHQFQTYPNLLSGLVVERPNFIYPACVLDARSRRCIGWQLSRTIDTRLALAASLIATSAAADRLRALR